MDKLPSIDDGYWVVFADTTVDDRTNKQKWPQETKGQLKKIRSFIFPAKYYDEKVKTAKELLQDLKPNGKVIPFINEGQAPFIYDRSFFSHMNHWEAFLNLWETIVKENAMFADRIMTRLFRAISQTALKIEYVSTEKLENNTSLEDFFQTAWNGDTENEWHYYKFLRKLWEMQIDSDWKTLQMSSAYNKLLRDFPDLELYTESICYQTFISIHNKVAFWPLGVMRKGMLN